jgi:hypothetical protein
MTIQLYQSDPAILDKLLSFKFASLIRDLDLIHFIKLWMGHGAGHWARRPSWAVSCPEGAKCEL